MKNSWKATLLLAPLVYGATPAWSQPPAAQPPAASPATAGQAGAGQAGSGPPAAFEAAFGEFKQSFIAFEKLRNEYQSADATRRAELDAELAQSYPSMKNKADKMVAAALAAYQSDPNADPKVT
ncbi:MAG: hypothetical protein AAF790_12950, partial [Planctomycetota bacterium]